MSFANLDESVVDAIPLTSSEKARKAELEAIVSTNLEAFLKVGAALAEIRSRRLFRAEFISFEAYCRSTFNLARSSADQLIRSASVAQSLIENGCALPSNVTEAAIRPLASLPDDDDLRRSCWELAESFASERGPTTRLVSKLCTVVRECLENPEDEKDGEGSKTGRPAGYSGPRPTGHELPFSRPVARLAGWSGFSATVIVASVDNSGSAAGLYRSCGILAERCRMVQETLKESYPELADA